MVVTVAMLHFVALLSCFFHSVLTETDMGSCPKGYMEITTDVNDNAFSLDINDKSLDEKNILWKSRRRGRIKIKYLEIIIEKPLQSEICDPGDEPDAFMFVNFTMKVRNINQVKVILRDDRGKTHPIPQRNCNNPQVFLPTGRKLFTVQWKYFDVPHDRKHVSDVWSVLLKINATSPNRSMVMSNLCLLGCTEPPDEKCGKVIEGCIKCEYEGGELVCLRCKPGLILFKNKCISVRPTPSEKCLDCMCAAQSGDSGTSNRCGLDKWFYGDGTCGGSGCVTDRMHCRCGPYLITEAQFDDCSSTVDLPYDDYRTCAWSNDCARMCITEFVGKYAEECTGKDVDKISCTDMATLLYGGKDGCKKKNKTIKFRRQVNRCMNN